jgi:hypothetical protein
LLKSLLSSRFYFGGPPRARQIIGRLLLRDEKDSPRFLIGGVKAALPEEAVMEMQRIIF